MNFWQTVRRQHLLGLASDAREWLSDHEVDTGGTDPYELSAAGALALIEKHFPGGMPAFESATQEWNS